MPSRTGSGRRLLSLLLRRPQLLPLLRETAPAKTPTPTLLLRNVQSRTPRRGYVSAPRPGDGPLMERRADRELPDIEASRFRWSRTLPVFLALIAASSVAIFNYQKSSSPVVASTLYALRTSPRARALLGDEIYFAARIPWIRGEMNQLRGRIDIAFAVRGTRGEAVMRFASHRPTARGVFETTEWSLETADGRKVDLLEGEGEDPFRGVLEGGPAATHLEDDYIGEEEAAERAAAATRGFRQVTKKT